MSPERLHGVTCGGCGEAGRVFRLARAEQVGIRELSFVVNRVLRRCDACGGEFESSRDPDWRTEAYARYRAAKGMVTPEALRAWREGQGLSAGELAGILGWRELTVLRYEAGSLQTADHDAALVILMGVPRRPN